ncbi:MAG TPA: FAD-dependent monooxygenase [Micromonosporaceae bacterium]
MTRAVVLGGGFGGVLAAAVLARYVDDVTLVEGGRYPASPGPRPGLPQAYHSHVLVTAGACALDALLPGTVDALLRHGAHRRGMPGDALIFSAEGWFRRHDTGAYLVSCSRWLTDFVVRGRALAAGTVSVRESTQVLGLVGDASRVTGVVVRRADGGTESLRADLVVDATGRRSRAGQWLAGIGAADVEETTVDPGLAYSTRVYRAPADLAAAIPAVMIHPRPEPGRPCHGATLFPIEDGQWIVTLTGTRGEQPPVDEAGFVASASALRSPVVAELLAEAEPVGGVRPFRGTANRRRFYERGSRPVGFLVLGDALMAVNPVYSHGMSVAAMSVLRLADELDRRGPDPSAFPQLQLVMAEVADRSWRMATDQERSANPGGAARQPSPIEREIRSRMARRVLYDPRLMTELFRAQTLISSNPVVDASVLAGASGTEERPLTADEAIAQYPGLSEWWSSRGRAVAPGCRPAPPGHRPAAPGTADRSTVAKQAALVGRQS